MVTSRDAGYIGMIAVRAILNAANEIAVQLFLDGLIGYLTIPRVIEEVMGRCRLRTLKSLDDVLAADTDARVVARQVVSELGRT